ncbi:MAG: hypothetical protein ACT4NY_33770 [Pseudonocardiales bacterium]
MAITTALPANRCPVQEHRNRQCSRQQHQRPRRQLHQHRPLPRAAHVTGTARTDDTTCPDYAARPGAVGPGRPRLPRLQAVFTACQVDLYPKSDFPTEQVYGNTEQPELRLITCGDSFNSEARSYRDNVVVFAKLTSAYWR